MKIKEIHIKDLVIQCHELLFTTVMELGQNKGEDWLVIWAQKLANDIRQDFKELDFIDIQQAFRVGVRSKENIDKQIILNVPTFYSWIRAHQQLIWNNSCKEPHRIDKRLAYRQRGGTGLKTIDSTLKQLKIGK